MAPIDDDLIATLCRDIIETISDRPNEAYAQRQARAANALSKIKALKPEDAAEVMFAGQVVLFQALALDAMQESYYATTSDETHRHRKQAESLGRVALSYIKEIRLHRAECRRADADAKATATPSPQPEADSVPTVQAGAAEMAPRIEMMKPGMPQVPHRPAPKSPPPAVTTGTVVAMTRT